jgi:hypothetical protein
VPRADLTTLAASSGCRESAQQGPCRNELHGGRQAACSVPTAEAVAREELPSAEAEELQHVLGVGCGSRGGGEDRRIERAPRDSESEEAGDSRYELVPRRADVLVRHSVAREMGEETQTDSGRPRSRARTDGGAGRDMEGDDHASILLAVRVGLPAGSSTPGRDT